MTPPDQKVQRRQGRPTCPSRPAIRCVEHRD